MYTGKRLVGIGVAKLKMCEVIERQTLSNFGMNQATCSEVEFSFDLE